MESIREQRGTFTVGKSVDRVYLGNREDLNAFCDYLNRHDKKTLQTYFRIASKKDSFVVIHRPASASPQMRVVVVPYKLAEASGGIRKVLNRTFHYGGTIQSLPLKSRDFLVFGALLEKGKSIGEFIGGR